MADNYDFTQGTGATARADDVGGVKYPVAKLDAGGDGASVPVVAGRQAAVASLPMVLSTEDAAKIDAITTKLSADPATQTTLAAVATLLTAIAGYVDGIEALVTSSNTKLDTLHTDTIAATPAGAAIIGKVGIDQTTDGTTNLVAAKQSGTWTEANSAALKTALESFSKGSYEAVAASQTTQSMGATGAVGDLLEGVLIIPGTTSPGAVSIKDGSNTAINIFAGGAASVSNLVPFFVPIGAISVQGAWQLTTGANVTAIGVGKFT